MNNTNLKLKHLNIILQINFPISFFCQMCFYIWTPWVYVYITSMLLLQNIWKLFDCFGHYNRLKVARSPCRFSPFSYLHSIKSCHLILLQHILTREWFLPSYPRSQVTGNDITGHWEWYPVQIVAQVTGISLQTS